MAIFRASATYPRENLRMIFKNKNISVADLDDPFNYFKGLHPVTDMIDVEIISGIINFIYSDLKISDFNGIYGTFRVHNGNCIMNPRFDLSDKKLENFLIITVYNFTNSGVASIDVSINNDHIYTRTSRDGSPYLNGFPETLVKYIMKLLAEILFCAFKEVKTRSKEIKIDW